MAADSSRSPDAVERFRLDVIAAAAVCLPIAWAALRAGVSDWVPIGDDAYFTVRSRDVGTTHHPWLGAWSSGSVETGRSVNNLGPIQLDVLSPFTRLAPHGGTAIAVAMVNIAAIVTVAWLLRRLGGRLVVVAAMVPVALLCWTLGSEMLITPRQHQFLVLCYLCVLVAAWSSAAGDRWGLVPLVAASSMVVQTHLSYPLLAAPLVVVGVGGQVVARRRADDPSEFDRPWVIAGVLLVGLWVQTVIDQFFGWGNLADVLLASSAPERPGWRRALEIVGHGLLDPSNAVRRGFADYRPDMSSGETVAIAGLAVMIVVLLGTLAWGLRSRRPTVAAGAAVGTTAVLAGVVNAAQLPVTMFGLTAANYRWLWPTATFLAIGALAAGVRYLPRRFDGRVGAVLLIAVVAASVANLPRSIQDPDPVRYVDRQDMVVAAMSQLAAADLAPGPIAIDDSRMPFGQPFSFPVALALSERDVDFRFTDPLHGRRFGGRRLADGTEAATLMLWHGDEAVERRDSPATIVWVEGREPFAITVEER